MMSSEDVKLCVGHRRPAFRLWEGFKFVTYQGGGDDDVTLDAGHSLARLQNDPVGPDRLLGEYHFLFGLRRTLERIPALRQVTICQYRRFVANRALGTPAENQPWTRVVSPEDAAALEVGDLSPRQGEWLVSSSTPCRPTVTAQYARHHDVRDWFRFLSDACDAGVLSRDDVHGASHQEILIPAPGVGSFPAAATISHLTILEDAAKAFLDGGYRPHQGYQERVLGFCLERLHSYLLLRELSMSAIELPAVQGHQVTVSESPTVVTKNEPEFGESRPK